MLLGALAGAAAAQEPGLTPLSQAFSEAGQLRFSPAPKAAEPAQRLSPPDDQTLAWLSQRVPGVDLADVRVVAADEAERVMRMAVDAQATYLDVISSGAFSGPTLFFLPQDVLDDVDAKFIPGTVSIKGNGEDGKPYQMQGFLIGQSRVEILYDREFAYDLDGHRYRVGNGGRVSARALGPGDVSIDGLSTRGVALFCPWPTVQRVTKESAAVVRVGTDCGARDVAVQPVRAR